MTKYLSFNTYEDEMFFVFSSEYVNNNESNN